MIVVDSFLEWLVVLFGILLALGVLFPGIANGISSTLKGLIPHPSTVNDWLSKIGL